MISIKVHEREIETLTKEKILKGSKNYFTCNISFDEFWDDYVKTIVFKKIYGNKAYVVKFDNSNNEIVIPQEILSESGKFIIGVFGIKEEILLPTLWSEEFEILNASDTSGEISEPTPDVYQQIINFLLAGGGNSITIDQIYNPDSKNAQSGKAVKQAIDQLPSMEQLQSYIDELFNDNVVSALEGDY